MKVNIHISVATARSKRPDLYMLSGKVPPVESSRSGVGGSVVFGIVPLQRGKVPPVESSRSGVGGLPPVASWFSSFFFSRRPFSIVFCLLRELRCLGVEPPYFLLVTKPTKEGGL